MTPAAAPRLPRLHAPHPRRSRTVSRHAGGNRLLGLAQRVTAALGLAGLVGGSVVVVFAVTNYDQVKLGRQGLYEDANRDSLSEQIEDMTAQAKAANADDGR